MDSCRSKKHFLNLNDLTKERNPWLELNSERAETAKCGGLGKRKGLRTPSHSPICNLFWLGGHSEITSLASRASLTSALKAVDLWKVYHSHYGAWSAWSGASEVGDGWREGEWVRQVFSPLRHLFSSLHICPTLFSLFVSVFCLHLVVWADNPQAPACFLIKLNNICGRHYLLKAKRVGQIHRCVRPCYYLD